MAHSIEREMFFKQLAEKAQQAQCFIYNPDRPITSHTSRLDIAQSTLSHTGWGLNEQQVWLEFYCFNKEKSAVQAEENRERFQKLFAHKDEIESAFGESLIWDFEPARIKQSVISRTPVIATAYNQAQWGEIQDDLIARTTRFGAVLKPYLT
jgi:Domain of unknown function (DUF4268)